MWLNVRGFDAALTEDAAWRMTAGAVATTRRRRGPARASPSRTTRSAAAAAGSARRSSCIAAFRIAGAAAGGARPGAVDLRPRFPLLRVARRPPRPARAGHRACHDAAARRRVARLRAAARRGGTAAGLCAAAREGRGDGSGHGPPDAAGSGLGGRRRPACIRRRMACDRRRRTTRGATTARSICCPITASPTRSCTSDSSATQPNASTTWRARPLWSIASNAGVAGRHRPLAADVSRGRCERLHRQRSLSPARRVDRRIRSRRQSARDCSGAVEATFADAGRRGASRSPPVQAAAADRPKNQRCAAIAGTARRCRISPEKWRPRLTALRYEGLDTVGHYYLRYTQPRHFRDVPDEDRRRFAQVIDRYYAYIDSELAAALDRAGARRSPRRRFRVRHAAAEPDQASGRSNARQSRLHRHARRCAGRFPHRLRQSVDQPAAQQRGSIVDVTPTVLYFLGLPVARDMDGFARADLFTRAFTADRPIVFIPSYSR